MPTIHIRNAVLLPVLAVLAIVLTLIVVFAIDGMAAESRNALRTEKVLKHFNRGVALMERFAPVKAAAEFRRVVKLLPEWIPGRWNLAVALLNTQLEKDLVECAQLLDQLAKDCPKSARVPYARGMLHSYRGELEDALAQFQRSHKLKPTDAHSLYQIGSLVKEQGKKKEAVEYFRRALDLHPALASAHYQLGLLLARSGKREEGMAHLERFKELERFKMGVKVAIKYTEMGPLADIVRHDSMLDAPAQEDTLLTEIHLRAAKLSEHVLNDVPEQGLSGVDRAATALGPRIVVSDFNGDGTSDVFIAAAATKPGEDLMLLSVEKGGYRDVTASGGVAPGSLTTCAAAGDYDEDGHRDLFVARAEKCILYRNRGDGTFEDVTSAAQLAVEPALYADVHWVDADQDGDLDLFLAGYASIENTVVTPGAKDRLFVNLGDGKFRPQPADEGFGPGDGVVASRAAVFSDFDDDGSLDLFIAVDGGPSRYYRNARALRFQDRTDKMGLAGVGAARGAFAGDLDGDGRAELFVLRGETGSPVLYRNRSPKPFERTVIPPETVTGATAGGIADFDLDGRLDVFLCGSSYATILVGDGRGGLRKAKLSSANGHKTTFIATGTAAILDDLDRNGTPDIVPLQRGSAITAWMTDNAKEHYWLRVALRGVKDAASSSNRDGVGAKIEVKAGDRWSVHEVGVGGKPGTPICVGLGERSKADYLRVMWPDGVLQSEMEISANQEILIEQVVRKPSSCPILFTWDGDKFRFITDFLGTGGLGFFLAPDHYTAPDPSEDVRIPPGALVPRDGKLMLRMQEPLEEVCFLDHVELLAVDHAPETELYPEERFGGDDPQPNGRLLVVRDRIRPRAARDATGRDVLGLLESVDRTWPEPPLHPRYTGFCRDHWLELEFDPQPPGELFLFLDGWVEYTYSHINYAATQAGVSLYPPVLEVPDGNGGWRVVRHNAGYPAGLPRTMAISLPPEVVAGGRFRLRTNMEIYWDRCFAARDLAGNGTAPRVTSLKPSAAELRRFGIPREYSPDGEYPPLYDYNRKDSGIFYRNIPGDYTRFGDVRPLTLEVDDQFVIFGRGEEVALEFDANGLPGLEKGWRRTYVMRTFGFCKDRSIYTAQSDGVGPLPFRGMSGYPYGLDEHYPEDAARREYRSTWNTRKVHDG